MCLLAFAPAFTVAAADPAPNLERAAALRNAGDWAKAAEAFRTIWRQGGESSRQEAALAYGRLCLLREDWAGAEAPLEWASEKDGPLEPYARFLLAECLFHENRPVDAALQIQRVAAQDPPRGLKLRLYRLSADVEHARGRPAREAKAWRRYLALKPSRGQRRLARFRLAGALEAEGQHHEAYRAYEHIYYRETGSPYGHRAGIAMRRLAQVHDYTLRKLSVHVTLTFARRLLAGGRPGDALACLSGLDDRRVPASLKPRVALARLKCSYSLRDNGAVLEQAGRMLERFGPCQQTLDALLKAAWTCIRTGDRDGVVHWAGLVLRNAGHDQQSKAEAYVAIGTSAYAAGAFSDAVKAFSHLHGVKAHRGTLASGLYRKAWCLYKLGEYENARKAFLAAARTYPERGFGAPARYWAAVCAMGRSRDSITASEMRRLASSGEGYWSLKAEAWLMSNGQKPGLPRLDVKGLKAWPEGARGGLAQRLALCGLEADAAEAFTPYYRAHRHDKNAAYTLALLYSRAGMASPADAVLRRAFGRTFDDPDGPGLMLAAAYPTPYLGLIRELCRKESVPVPLAMALIRRESGFDPGALSPVGARGFMQLMPATARQMSDDLKIPPAPDEALHDPVLNLTLGLHYLGRLLKDLPPAGAVAAYNAGSDLVWSWLDAFRPTSQEAFVGMIPYTETRAYTAGVLRDALAYGRLLGLSAGYKVSPSPPEGTPPS